VAKELEIELHDLKELLTEHKFEGWSRWKANELNQLVKLEKAVTTTAR